MMRIPRTLILALAPAAVLLAPAAAHADGDVRCKAGPQASWKPLAELRKKAWLEGWKVQKTQIEGDCYEVYVRYSCVTKGISGICLQRVGYLRAPEIAFLMEQRGFLILGHRQNLDLLVPFVMRLFRPRPGFAVIQMTSMSEADRSWCWEVPNQRPPT